jgi:dienelactone hydrolase
MTHDTRIITSVSALMWRCGLGLLILANLGPSTAAAMQETVSVPWRPGNSALFQSGTPEEQGRQATQGVLPVRIYRSDEPGRMPFVVLLHGCGGLHYEAMWHNWVEPWASLFSQQRIGTAVVDSFGPRGVDQVCTHNVGAWAVRRADDAYSVRAWLAEQPYVDPQRIAVMGMSNGGRTVLAALLTTLQHPQPFFAGIALYPGCQSDVDSRFYAPLLVLSGRADTVAPASYCEAMQQAQPARRPNST